MKSKTPQDHLNEAANNLGYDDFMHLQMCEENSVVEPIVLGRMDTYAKQQASEVIKELEFMLDETSKDYDMWTSRKCINLIKKHFNII